MGHSLISISELMPVYIKVCIQRCIKRRIIFTDFEILRGNFLHGVFQSCFHFLKSELYLCKSEISYLQRRCLSYRTSQCRPEERQDWRRNGGSSSDHEINPPTQVVLLSRRKKTKALKPIPWLQFPPLLNG